MLFQPFTKFFSPTSAVQLINRCINAGSCRHSFATKPKSKGSFVNPKEFSKPRPNTKDPNTLVAFCGSSAIRNATADCKATFACVFPHNAAWNVSSKLPSNVKHSIILAEYMAVLAAIHQANIADPSQNEVLCINTSSKKLLRSMTKRLPIWIKDNWTKRDGNPVKHKDILVELRNNQGLRSIIWGYTKLYSNNNDWQSFWITKAHLLATKARHKD